MHTPQDTTAAGPADAHAGLSNAEIAERLFLGAGTVKTYISRILSRVDCRDRVQLAMLAYETGLVRPGSPPAR